MPPRSKKKGDAAAVENLEEVPSDGLGWAVAVMTAKELLSRVQTRSVDAAVYESARAMLLPALAESPHGNQTQGEIKVGLEGGEEVSKTPKAKPKVREGYTELPQICGGCSLRV